MQIQGGESLLLRTSPKDHSVIVTTTLNSQVCFQITGVSLELGWGQTKYWVAINLVTINPGMTRRRCR